MLSLGYRLTLMALLASAGCAANSLAAERDFVRIHNSIGIQLILIPAGEFTMGSPLSEAGRHDDETQHRVGITSDYWIGRFEVTQRQYEKVTGKNPSYHSANGWGRYSYFHREQTDTRGFPVDSVTWADAQDFCRLLSELPEEKEQGRRYRLPTEAEWEFACRAGSTEPFGFGDSLSAKDANINGSEPYGRGKVAIYWGRSLATHSFDSRNASSLFDMHGNIVEWCQDYYGPYDEKRVTVDPTGPETGNERVVRGGWFDCRAADCRSASRHKFEPDRGVDFIGLRVVMVQKNSKPKWQHR